MLDTAKVSLCPKSNWRPSISFWIVSAILLILVIIFSAAGGLGVALVILGIVALITALYALLFKRRSWVGIPHRKSALLVAGSGIALFIVGGMVAAATASSTGTQNKSALVATASASATPTATNPSKTACLTASDTKTYNNDLFVCTMGTDQRLVWLPEAESKKVVAKASADKVAAEKAAADKVAADKTAADKAAADKIAADKAAADKVAADQLAAQQAADAAAAQAAQQTQAPVPAPAAPAPATGYVTAGAFCSGGVGVSKTGKAMVCAPAADGRMRWRSA